jgi:hypothetical protein
MRKVMLEGLRIAFHHFIRCQTNIVISGHGKCSIFLFIQMLLKSPDFMFSMGDSLNVNKCRYLIVDLNRSKPTCSDLTREVS